jgi:hypothetical protein
MTQQINILTCTSLIYIHDGIINIVIVCPAPVDDVNAIPITLANVVPIDTPVTNVPDDVDTLPTTDVVDAETPVTADPVEADTFAVTVVPAVDVMPVTKFPVDVDAPVNADPVDVECVCLAYPDASVVHPVSDPIPVRKVPLDVETPVIADPVVKSLLSTLIPVTNVPVDVETPETTVDDVVETPVIADAVVVDGVCVCPVYDTTLPAVAVEKVTNDPADIAPSATTCATPNTNTLTFPPEDAESIATPTTFVYVDDDG